MYVGTQIEPRDDTDFQVWAQLGVTHVCVDPPGSPHHWSLDALRRHKDHVESFGLSLDMVQLPISSGPKRPRTDHTSCWPRVQSGSARSTASAG
jgi:mannonate dehydratase